MFDMVKTVGSVVRLIHSDIIIAIVRYKVECSCSVNHFPDPYPRNLSSTVLRRSRCFEVLLKYSTMNLPNDVDEMATCTAIIISESETHDPRPQ